MQAVENENIWCQIFKKIHQFHPGYIIFKLPSSEKNQLVTAAEVQ